MPGYVKDEEESSSPGYSGAYAYAYAANDDDDKGKKGKDKGKETVAAPNQVAYGTYNSDRESASECVLLRCFPSQSSLVL